MSTRRIDESRDSLTGWMSEGAGLENGSLIETRRRCSDARAQAITLFALLRDGFGLWVLSFGLGERSVVSTPKTRLPRSVRILSRELKPRTQNPKPHELRRAIPSRS